MSTNGSAKGAANSSVWRMLDWAGVVLQLMALVFVLWSQQMGRRLDDHDLFGNENGVPADAASAAAPIDFPVVLVALINAGGWSWEWYQTFVWFDEFVHAFTSFAVISAIAFIAWSQRWTNAASGGGALVLRAAAVGFGPGIVWEVFESLFLNLTFWDT